MVEFLVDDEQDLMAGLPERPSAFDRASYLFGGWTMGNDKSPALKRAMEELDAALEDGEEEQA